MFMTVGTDSYVSLDDANAYVKDYRNAVVNEAWDSKSDEDKTRYLTDACSELEGLPFVGAKKDSQQALSFPRWPASTVPPQIGAAQIEIALLSLIPDTRAGEASQRAALQRQGVTSFSLGDLSESYGGVNPLFEEYPFMASERVYRLLKRFLSGGYAIC